MPEIRLKGRPGFWTLALFLAQLLVFPLPLQAGDWSPAQQRQGAELFQQRCAMCHGNDGMGEGVLSLLLPDYPNTNLLMPRLTDNLAEIRQAIGEGPAFKDASTFMPPWRDELKPSEIDLLARFVEFMRVDPEQAREVAHAAAASLPATPRIGHALFLGRCADCHGHAADGRGRRAGMLKPRPADLIHSRLPDAEMRRVIALGGEATGRSPAMPPWGREFSRTEIEAILLHLRKLRETYRPQTGAEPEQGRRHAGQASR